MHRAYILILAIFGLLPAGAARAQLVTLTGGVSAAGGVAEGGTVSLFAAAGDPAGAGMMSGGSFDLAGGVVAMVSTAAVPSIDHSVPPLVSGDEPVLISAQVAGGARGAVLHYRRGGEAAYRSQVMQMAEGSFVATLPDSLIGSRGLTYFIVVEDEIGRPFRSPALGAYTLQISLSGEGVVRDVAQPSGTSQSAYRLVSVPLRLSDPRPESVLVDDLGEYDPEEWRFFGLDFNQEYDEFAEIDSLLPGRGYWLITRQEGRVLDTGPGTTLPTNEPFMVLLHPRWNLIGTPFNFPLDVSQLRLASGRPLSLRALDQGWNDPVRQPVRTMRPFEGYAVFNELQRVDTLLMFPHPGSGGGSASVAAAAKTSDPEWTVHLIAETADARDADNAIGVRIGASEGHDAFEHPEPPRVGEFVALDFPRASWSELTDVFSTDFREPTDQGHAWDFRVRGGEAEVVQLRFEQLSDVPAEWDVWLIDEFLGVAADLASEPRYQLVTSSGHDRLFRVVAGTPEFVGEHRPAPSEVPRRVAVTDVFPNPFSVAATVRYEVPEPGPVRVRVYNALGQEVARLADRTVDAAGAQLAVWDGTSMNGTLAPSGIYFIQVDAGRQSHTAKVVLVR